MEIRYARDDDAGQIVELLGELGYSVTGEHVHRRLRQGAERVLVADDDGTLLGLVSIVLQSTLMSLNPSARLMAVVVRSDARRGGVGRTLIHAAIAHAREQGCTGIELTSSMRPEREAAHRFYPALGFARTSYRYWLPLDGAGETPVSGSS
jgi:GNAT superfamily N-acetyltransferase